MIRMGFPSVGSWVTYGLGSESQSLPAFVVIYDARGGPFGGPSNWSAGFMPAAYQGRCSVPRALRSSIWPSASRSRRKSSARGSTLLAKLNDRSRAESRQLRAGRADRVLRTRVSDAGLRAGGGRSSARETEATRKLYGLDDPVTEPFGRQCLMARRLVERGVRFVQLYHGGLGNQNTDTWDAHEDVKSNHTKHAAEVDLPDRRSSDGSGARGLLDSTLVIWQGEFGRMPISQRGVGRDHNPGAMSIWMAGARIKGGQVIGSSDEFGYKAEEQPISVHDLHATMLHCSGWITRKLTYRFNGRDMRLTDVYGEPVPQIVQT